MSETRERIYDLAWTRRLKRGGKPRRGKFRPTMWGRAISLTALQQYLRARRGRYRR